MAKIRGLMTVQAEVQVSWAYAWGEAYHVKETHAWGEAYHVKETHTWGEDCWCTSVNENNSRLDRIRYVE